MHKRSGSRLKGIGWPLEMIAITCFALLVVFSFCVNHTSLRVKNDIVKLRRSFNATPLVPKCGNMTIGTSSAHDLCKVVHKAVYRLLQEHNNERNLGVLQFAEAFACYVVSLTFERGLEAKVSHFFLYEVRKTTRAQLRE